MNKGALTEKVHELENQLSVVMDELSTLRKEMVAIHEGEKQSVKVFHEIINDLQRLNHCKKDKDYF